MKGKRGVQLIGCNPFICMQNDKCIVMMQLVSLLPSCVKRVHTSFQHALSNAFAYK